MPGTFREKIVQTDEEQLTFTDVKALVVDDDYMNLMVAKGILKSYGIAADTSLSGEKAIERCSFTDYQIIFMDHMMPGMNGVEAMHKIRELRNGHYKSIPIVALTANAVSGAREMFLGEGFDEFISKPIELTSMTRLLRKMLKGESANE
jgi:CheY-like chemotaxis protein